jgi:hypothetical protein
VSEAPGAETPDVPSELGFGTDYEKWLLEGIVGELQARYGFRTAADYPCNLLLGDSRDVFRKAGVDCSRLTAPARGAPYDLVFSFCEFEQADDPRTFLETLDGFGSRFVLIVTQNWRNPGVPLHRLYHLLSRAPWDHGRISRASDRAVLRAVRRGGFRWRLAERRCFDTPWFVLDVYETGRLLRRLVPERKRRAPSSGMAASRFEAFPLPIARFLAHHFLLLFERDESGMPGAATGLQTGMNVAAVFRSPSS